LGCIDKELINNCILPTLKVGNPVILDLENWKSPLIFLNTLGNSHNSHFLFIVMAVEWVIFIEVRIGGGRFPDGGLSVGMTNGDG